MVSQTFEREHYWVMTQINLWNLLNCMVSWIYLIVHTYVISSHKISSGQ